MMRRELREQWLWRACTVAIIGYALTPVAWILSLSLKRPSDLNDGRFFPAAITFDNYRTVFSDAQFPAALRNSFGIALIATGLSVLLATFAAYAIARLAFPGKNRLLAGVLTVSMFPQVSIIGPLFNLWRHIGLFDTWAGLVIPYMTFTLPLAIWILTAFFRQLPWELDKAARIDGATPLQAFIYIIAPLAAPGVFTAAILVFIFAWNDFLFAASLTSTNAARTVPAAIAFFTGSSQFEQPTGAIAAASMIVTIPAILTVLLFQRYIVAGLTAGAVKG